MKFASKISQSLLGALIELLIYLRNWNENDPQNHQKFKIMLKVLLEEKKFPLTHTHINYFIKAELKITNYINH